MSICGQTASSASAASARRQRTSGSSESGAPSFFIDVRRRAAATPSSSARSAMPVYTDASSVSNVVKIPTTRGSRVGPGGSRRTTRSTGANAPSSTVERDCDARMPIVSQSSSTWTPASRDTNACPRRGASRDWVSSPSTPSRVHAGEFDVKILRPWNVYPPRSSGRASVREPSSTRSLPPSE
ncbi:Uncharacterised protein [Mycobacteroides abscessus]|nr:Uncharacterised protein [Mycobacteroides abscessus]